MNKPLAIITEPIDRQCAAWLSQRCEVLEAPAGSDAFEQRIGAASALVVRTYTEVGGALLERAGALRVVGRAGVGVDNIDLSACRDRGVVVVNTPEANAGAVAEYVWALIFDALRPRLFLDKAIDSERWKTLRDELVAPRQLSDLTLGILGFGRIGARVARVAVAMGMRVVYFDVRSVDPDESGPAEPVSQRRLHEESDVISVHVDGRPSNRALIGAAEFAHMKDDAVFINTSRGFVVDASALADFLADHPAAQALLDVHEPEPIDAANPLLNLPNAHLSPHIAAATARAKKNMSWVVEDVWRVFSGEPPRHVADA